MHLTKYAMLGSINVQGPDLYWVGFVVHHDGHVLENKEVPALYSTPPQKSGHSLC
jgi:hypothetical protein